MCARLQTALEPRTEMLYNVDGCDFSTGSALRVRKYKLIEDVQFLPAWPAPRAAALQRTVSVPEDVHFWWNRRFVRGLPYLYIAPA